MYAYAYAFAYTQEKLSVKITVHKLTALRILPCINSQCTALHMEATGDLYYAYAMHRLDFQTTFHKYQSNPLNPTCLSHKLLSHTGGVLTTIWFDKD